MPHSGLCCGQPVEEQFKALPSVEAFAEKLDETEPRYLLYIHKVAHRDGRVPCVAGDAAAADGTASVGTASGGTAAASMRPSTFLPLNASREITQLWSIAL